MFKKLALGLMSGTSADGVSAAIISLEKEKIELQAYGDFPYPRQLRRLVLNAIHLKTPGLSRLNFKLGEFFAKAALGLMKKSRIPPKRIAVIGSHGQTVYHGPSDGPPNTLQIGEPSIIAERTGLPVVANFRSRDIAAGGEGAPLVPYFDWFYYKNEAPIALLNIGGIANVTIVTQSPNEVLGFDTGPGNCLLDLAIGRLSKGRLLYDAGGNLAYQGKINEKAVAEALKYPFFKRKPPKSTGRELFDQKFLNTYFKKTLKKSLKDTAATLAALTARSIYQALERFILPKHAISKIIASGGGARNVFILSQLSSLLRSSAKNKNPVLVMAEDVLPCQTKEPMAFALFALQALNGKTNHLPSATGARHQRILGAYFPP